MKVDSLEASLLVELSRLPVLLQTDQIRFPRPNDPRHQGGSDPQPLETFPHVQRRYRPLSVLILLYGTRSKAYDVLWF